MSRGEHGFKVILHLRDESTLYYDETKSVQVVIGKNRMELRHCVEFRNENGFTIIRYKDEGILKSRMINNNIILIVDIIPPCSVSYDATNEESEKENLY